MTKPKWIRNGSWMLWCMALPCAIFILLFCYVPLFGWSYAFVRYQPGTPLLDSQFVGLKYFHDIFASPEIGRVLRNTMVFSALGLAVTPLPILFAIVLSEINGRWFQKTIQTITTFPNFISWIVVYAISLIVFSVDDGFLNKMLLSMGIIEKPLNLLADRDVVWYLQTAFGVWKSLGFNAIIYFAAISGIDQELFDAAAVDGAGRFRRIWHIKVPGIMPTFVVLFLLSVGNLLNTNFDQLYVFYNPIIHETIQTLDLYVYKVGMEQGNYSLSTAVGIFKTFVSVTLLFSANFLSKKVSGKSVL